MAAASRLRAPGQAPTGPQPSSLRYKAEGPPGPGALRPLLLPSDLERQRSCGPSRARVCTASEGFRLLEGVGAVRLRQPDARRTPPPGCRRGVGRGCYRRALALRESPGHPMASNCASLFQLSPVLSPWPPSVLPRILAWRSLYLKRPPQPVFPQVPAPLGRAVEAQAGGHVSAAALVEAWPLGSALRPPLVTARASPRPPAPLGKTLISFRSQVSRREGSLPSLPAPFPETGDGGFQDSSLLASLHLALGPACDG